MKNLYILISITCATALQAQWTLVPAGTLKTLYDVHFPSDSVGYCVGDSGTVLKSLDIGTSWQQVHSNHAMTFSSVFFTDNMTGYAAAGDLYKTTDGGLSWNVILTDTNNSVAEVYFVNDSLGFAGAHEKVYRTLDAGATWAVCISAFNDFTTIHFPSPNVGYFIGGPGYSDPLFRTNDGGVTFTQIGNQMQSIKESVYFINDTIGYMCGWYVGMVAKTANGGMTWKLMDTINDPQGWDVYFIDEMTGYYLARSYFGQSVIRKTVDGGVNWTTDLATQKDLVTFHFIDPLNAIAVGYQGVIYKKTTTTTGLQKHGRTVVNFYPNPSRGLLQIRNAGLPFHIKMYNMKGDLVREELIASETMDISDLPAGMYHIRARFGDRNQSVRVIVE
jgi:photosystem II stability/assembly factor-like uncharacterized protein